MMRLPLDNHYPLGVEKDYRVEGESAIYGDGQSTSSSLKDVVLQGDTEASTSGKCRHLKTADTTSSSRLVRLLDCDVAARACRSVDIQSKSPIARPLGTRLRAHSARG